MSVAVDIRTRRSAEFALDVAFTTARGITILFGASGSGKTSVLRCLAGLMRPDNGRIAFGDRVVFDSSHAVDIATERRGVGYVFQQLALFPHMTIERNIAYGLHQLAPAVRRERVRSIADSFAIAHLLDRTPGQVSGGERQRAALARSLVSAPSVLLLDEPLSALDHRIRMRIMDDLRRWNETHAIPVVYVTHSHQESFALGEHMILLEGGKVVAQGSPHEVLDRPSLGVMASLAGFENVFDATVVARDEHGGTMICQVGNSSTSLEVPLGDTSVGTSLRIGIRAGDILVATHEPRALSAKNVLPCTLRSLTRQGATVVAGFEAGRLFTVHLTPGSLERMHLREGDDAWLIMKTYSCRVLAQ